MIKKLLLFGLLITIFSCSTTKRLKRSCKENPFIELDSITKSNQKLNYTIFKPKGWKKGRTGKGDSFFLQGNFIDSLGYYSIKASVFISKNTIKDKCKNEIFSSVDYLNYFINYKNKWNFDEFKYKLFKTKHRFYGDIHIVKFNEKISDTKTYIRSNFLFFENNIGYTVEYVGEAKYYDLYLLDVEKMINSFKALE